MKVFEERSARIQSHFTVMIARLIWCGSIIGAARSQRRAILCYDSDGKSLTYKMALGMF